MPRICVWKGCNTVLSFCNQESYCFMHQRKKLLNEARKGNHKLLEKSKKFKQISNWIKDWKTLRHFKQTLPNLLLCQRKNKDSEGKQTIEYAVFAKAIGEGIELKKRDLVKKLQF